MANFSTGAEFVFQGSGVEHGVWLQTGADALIALICFSVAAALVMVLKRNPALPFRKGLGGLVALGLICGTAHALEICSLWLDNPWPAGVAKVLLAVSLVPTAFVFARALPNGTTEGGSEEPAPGARPGTDLAGARLAAIVESSSDAIVGKDLQGIVTSWNKGAELMFGYSAGEMIGNPITRVIPPERQGDEQMILERICRGETVEHFETRRLRKDGRPFDVSVTVSPIRDSSGRVIGASKVARDISDRRGMERQLAITLQEVNQLKTALDKHAIVVITDPEGRITRVNENYCEVSQYSRAELRGQFHPLIRSGAHAEPYLQDLWTTIAHGHVWRGEVQERAKDGSRYWLETTIVPSVEDSGAISRYVAIQTDVTKTKLAVQALRESEARLQAVTENLSEGLVVAELDGRLIHWNRACLAMHAFHSLEEVLRHLEYFSGIFEMTTFAGDVLDLSEWPMARVLRGETLRNYEIHVRRRDMDWHRILRYSGEIIHDTSGRSMAYLAIHDITDAWKTELALRLKEEQLHASDRRLAEIMHRMTEACFAVDAHWHITFVNDQGETLLRGHSGQRLPSEDLLGRPIWEIFPRIAGTPLEANCVRSMREQAPVAFEFLAPGLERWLDVRLFPTADGLAAFLLDIDQRKRTEAEVHRLNAELEERVAQRTAQLEAANQELEAFSYSVSHDLRAPLRAIDGFSQALIEDFGPQLPADAQDYLQTIRQGAQQMGTLIDDLLTFSRLSRSPLQRCAVNTNALVNTVLEDLMREHRDRNVVVRCGNLPACLGDPALLKQVWVNLLSNAFKYTLKRPNAAVEIESSRTVSGEMLFSVRDNGTGFDMRYAAKLFGVFQRLHRADEFEGTGVGLAIVKRIVQRHHGRVWAESVVGQGATFTFTLPALPPP